MVFNLLFHLIWYTAKAIQTLVHRLRSPEGDPAAASRPKSGTTTFAARPDSDVRKLCLTFALSFTAIHWLMTAVAPPPERGAIVAAEAKTRVGTDGSNFFCADDLRPAREKETAQKTAKYYLQNFGVAQTIDGNGEENRRMRDLADGMEGYFKKWIETNDHADKLKEKCINKHDKCVFWASINECTKNPGYMENNCMLACQKCDKLLEPPDSANRQSSGL